MPNVASVLGDPHEMQSFSQQARVGRYEFKRAETPAEFEQIHRLNYATFVREIGQYTDAGQTRLVDKFHDKNTYFIAVRDGRVVGMIAVHDQPPFSITDRLADPDDVYRLGPRPLEVRLFAVDPAERQRAAFTGLAWMVLRYARAAGYTHMLISGVGDRLAMYERMGFRPLGPAVQGGQAWFTPMAMDVQNPPENIQRDARSVNRRARISAPAKGPTQDFLPGPVRLAPGIRAALAQPPISHRSSRFEEMFTRVRRRLSTLAGGHEVGIFAGSGTLANDVIAATLAATPEAGRGLILINGEFGERLATQAGRFGLDFRTLRWDWGQRWDLSQVAHVLQREGGIGWIWGVHLETSAGLLNDVAGLIDLSARHDVRVCLDSISGLGAVPVDLARAHLVASASGKSLGSMAGLGLVFASERALEEVRSDRVPTYLDIAATIRSAGTRFTIASPLLGALDRALEAYATPMCRAIQFERYAAVGRHVRLRLEQIGLRPLVDDAAAAPVITTFLPPDGADSVEFIERCAAQGFNLHGLSGYLREKNWVQIATMGNISRADCDRLLDQLEAWCRSAEGAQHAGPPTVMA